MRLFGGVFRRGPSDDEIARELRDHLELEAEELKRGGSASPLLAAGAARRRFGNLGMTGENVRAVWRIEWLDQLRQDLRHGARALIRSPAYTIAAVITLGLGIGSGTTMYSVIDGVLLHPFPALRADRLVWITQPSSGCGSCEQASPAALNALATGAKSLRAAIGAATWRTALRVSDGSQLLDGFRVTPNTFDAIGAPFALGHGFVAAAGAPGAEPTVVLSWQLWHDSFRESPGVLDSTITLNGTGHTVVGVLARGITFPTAAAFYAPLAMSATDAENHGSRYLELFGRLAPGANIHDVSRDANVVAAQLAREAPATDSAGALVVRPLDAFHTSDVAPLLAVCALAVMLVLLAACVSVANLALARGASRTHEMSLRAALGGRRGRLLRHLLAESLIVSLAGGLLGTGFALWAVAAARRSIPPSFASYLPGFALMRVNGRALLFTLALCVAVTLVFALLPALRATRLNLTSVLSDGGRATAGGVRGTRTRGLLVVVEVSVALVLLNATTLSSRSVWNMLRGDPGVRIDHVLTMHYTLPHGLSDSTRSATLRDMTDALNAIPGVRAAGLTSTAPLSNNYWGVAFKIPGRPPEPNGAPLSATDEAITARYFEAAGIRVVSGRGIGAGDTWSSPSRAAVINQYMAEKLWPGRDPVGETLTIDSLPWTIVGVASNVYNGGLDESLRYTIYRSALQAPSAIGDIAMWMDRDPASRIGAARRAVASANADAGIGEPITMEALELRHVSAFKLIANALSLFAGITTLIAVVGLYGLIAYGAAQRTRELGVRVALGARGWNIANEVAGAAVRLTGVGVAIGLAGALGFAQLLRAILYGVTASDPRVPLVVAAGLILVTLLAALAPTLRATRVNPVIALRE